MFPKATTDMPGFSSGSAWRVSRIAGIWWQLTFWVLFEALKQHHVAALGWLLIAVAVATLIGVPIYQFSRWLRQLGRFPEMKTMRVWATLGVLSLLSAGFFLMPLPHKVRGIALVQVMPEQVQRVAIPETEGFLAEIRVRDGQHVNAGEVLAILTNPKLQIKLRLNEADQALRYQQQHAFVAQFADLAPTKGDQSSDWQQCELELKSLVQARQTLQEQCDRLISAGADRQPASSWGSLPWKIKANGSNAAPSFAASAMPTPCVPWFWSIPPIARKCRSRRRR